MQNILNILPHLHAASRQKLVTCKMKPKKRFSGLSSKLIYMRPRLKPFVNAIHVFCMQPMPTCMSYSQAVRNRAVFTVPSRISDRVLNELIHPIPWFNRHLFHAGRRSVVWPTLSFVWSRMTAAVKLSTRYPTADSVVDIGSTSASVE